MNELSKDELECKGRSGLGVQDPCHVPSWGAVLAAQQAGREAASLLEVKYVSLAFRKLSISAVP